MGSTLLSKTASSLHEVCAWDSCEGLCAPSVTLQMAQTLAKNLTGIQGRVHPAVLAWILDYSAARLR